MRASLENVEGASLAEYASTLALAVALAACAGLRAWLPLLAAGLFARADWLELGPAFEFLTSGRALALFGVATAVEIAGDKIPALDHALDSAGTVLRPAAGALLAAAVLGQITDPLTSLALGAAVGVPSALVPHAAKSALRLASTALTAGLANPVVSLIEDAITLVLLLAAVLLPLLVVALLALLGLLLLRRGRRQRAATAA
jgi:hypothetical protein